MDTFDEQGFMDYMEAQFPAVFTGDGSSFTRSMLDNIIQYAQQYRNHAKDQLCMVLCELIPEITFGEVAMFAPDADLTASYGLVEKRRAQAARN